MKIAQRFGFILFTLVFSLLFAANSFAKSTLLSGPARALNIKPIFLNQSFLPNKFSFAPGGPGIIGSWARPDKDGFLSVPKQDVRATIAEGILTEVEYPTIDRGQTRDTQLLLVVDGEFLEERKNFEFHVTRYPQSLAYHVSSVNRALGIRIEKDIFIDTDRNVVRLDYDINLPAVSSAKIYVIHNPSADNTAGGDAMFVNQKAPNAELLAYQSDRRGDEPPAFKNRTVQLLSLDRSATESVVGFEGVNDPWSQISAHKKITAAFDSAANGNVAGALGFEAASGHTKLRVALSLAEETSDTVAVLREMAQSSFQKSFDQILTSQQSQWRTYLNSLNPIGRKNEVHMLVMKSLEDKNFKGSIVAGPTIPSLPDRVESYEGDYESARTRSSDQNSGYRRVWMRDAFQMGLGLLAGGDTETPLNILRNYKRVQKANGNFPQNTWVDGTISWKGFQIDQTGFPIVLVSRLVELGLANYQEFRPMVLAAANAMVKAGPHTEQERWEENGGFSPNSMAIACQGLMEASFLETSINLANSSLYSNTCQAWKDQLLALTYIDSGPLGEGYFERIEVANPGDPKHNALIFIGNSPSGGSNFLEKEIMDGGFIQWMISGLVPAQDRHFTSSLEVYDRTDRVPIAAGQGYIRYNHDGYGIGHIGRSWPLLSGERALAALYQGVDPTSYIDVMMSSQSSGGMMPEQTEVSASPLGWAHAEVLIVSRSLSDNKSFYIPQHLNFYFHKNL